MRIIVVNAPSGVALTATTDKIKAFLANPPADYQSAFRATVAVEDVESELLDLFRAHYPNEKLSAAGPMQDVLSGLPRDAITQHYWPQAANSAFKKLLTGQSDVRILRCHLTYYREATREFYAAGDVHRALAEAIAELKSASPEDTSLAERLAEARVALVLTLIDDVFDMFHRLSGEEQVFPLLSYIKEEYVRRKNEGGDIPSAPSNQYVLAFEHVITILHRLLEWRSREMTSGDMLARRFDAEHFVLAIKHATETAVSLVRLGYGEESLVPVYLSHPISEPRRLQKKHPAKEWDKFVTEFQTFVEAAAEVKVDGKRAIFFMPTAIDELRFADLATTPNFPTLERRWPLIQHKHGLLYDTPPGQDYEAFESAVLLNEIFNPLGGTYKITEGFIDEDEPGTLADTYKEVRLPEAAKNAVHALAGGLLQQMKIQLAIRDHALVRQSGRLLLYRPFFAKGSLSGGVDAELKNWSVLLQTASEFKKRAIHFAWRLGPAIVIHDAKDLGKLDELLMKRMKTNLIKRLTLKLQPEELGLLDFDLMSGSAESWFDQALKPEDQLLGSGRTLTRTKKRALKVVFQDELEAVERDSRRMAYLGTPSEPPRGLDYLRYDRLAEQTHLGFQKLASEEILPKLFAEI
ncbi:MAG TPA: hypothetical protein VEM96_00935 [Pyrinomonadaceae bacterium]|nr:hypothetical protein [Pyrinomonadaceae bacterium]